MTQATRNTDETTRCVVCETHVDTPLDGYPDLYFCEAHNPNLIAGQEPSFGGGGVASWEHEAPWFRYDGWKVDTLTILLRSFARTDKHPTLEPSIGRVDRIRWMFSIEHDAATVGVQIRRARTLTAEQWKHSRDTRGLPEDIRAAVTWWIRERDEGPLMIVFGEGPGRIATEAESMSFEKQKLIERLHRQAMKTQAVRDVLARCALGGDSPEDGQVERADALRRVAPEASFHGVPFPSNRDFMPMWIGRGPHGEHSPATARAVLDKAVLVEAVRTHGGTPDPASALLCVEDFLRWVQSADGVRRISEAGIDLYDAADRTLPRSPIAIAMEIARVCERTFVKMASLVPTALCSEVVRAVGDAATSRRVVLLAAFPGLWDRHAAECFFGVGDKRVDVMFPDPRSASVPGTTLDVRQDMKIEVVRVNPQRDAKPTRSREDIIAQVEALWRDLAPTGRAIVDLPGDMSRGLLVLEAHGMTERVSLLRGCNAEDIDDLVHEVAMRMGLRLLRGNR